VAPIREWVPLDSKPQIFDQRWDTLQGTCSHGGEGSIKNVDDGIESWIEGVDRLIRTIQYLAESRFVRLE